MVGVWGEGRAGEDGEAAPVQAPGEGVVWGWDLLLFHGRWCCPVWGGLGRNGLQPQGGSRGGAGISPWGEEIAGVFQVENWVIVTRRGGNTNRILLSCPELPSSPGRQLQ